MQFVPFELGIEVNGQTVYSVMDGFDIFKKTAHDVLAQRGIGQLRSDGTLEIVPTAWYSQAAWLQAVEKIAGLGRRIAAMGAGPDILFRIGMTIPRNAAFPPWVQDIHSAIRSVDIAYHMNHRKGGAVMFDEATGAMQEGIGHYGYAAVEGRREILSVCSNPYPCEFDRGILTAMATKFEPGAVVTHDPVIPCRKSGHPSCTYRIRW